MNLSNQVQLIGNLGRDVELMVFDSGNKKASISLATTEYHKNEKGELVKSTQWHNVIAWGKNAELIAKAVSKGSKLAIQGMLNYRTYQDKAGATQKIAEILVSEFMKINEPSVQTNIMTDPRPF